jgi:hypothetical protein
MKPARKVVTRSPHRSVGYVACAGIDGSHAEHESSLEKSFVLIANVCSCVKGLGPQPFRIEWRDSEDKVRTYVPDFQVHFNDGSKAVIEVKPEKFVAKNRELFQAATKHLARANQNFYVLTDKQLTPARTDTALLMRRYRRTALPADQVEHATRLVTDGLSWTEAQSSAVPLHVWYGLLGQRLVHIKVADLQATTRLFLGRGEEHDSQVQFQRWFGCSPWRSSV